jgi:hypothetical protein
MNWGWILFGIAVLLIGTTLSYSYLSWRKSDRKVIIPKNDCSSCDGTNTKCEQECLMEAATKEIEYYDDEELDKYKGRASEQYTDEEAEEFRYVMMTMQKDEVKGWNRSLILRGVALPNQVKDEMVMLME